MVVACVFSLFGHVQASTGGNEAAEILGFDRKSRTLYWAIHDHSEAGELPQVMYLFVDSADAGSRLYEPTTDPPSAAAYNSWVAKSDRLLDSLRTRLVAVEPIPPESVRLTARALSRGYWSETNSYGRTTQTIWELTARCVGYSGRGVVTAFSRDSLGISWAGHVPDQPWIIAIVTYPGIPWEAVYTRDLIMVLRRE